MDRGASALALASRLAASARAAVVFDSFDGPGGGFHPTDNLGAALVQDGPPFGFVSIRAAARFTVVGLAFIIDAAALAAVGRTRERGRSRRRARAPSAALLGLACAALVIASESPAHAFETGAVCVRDHVSGLDCTGPDVLPTGLVAAQVVEPCGSALPDTALVVLDVAVAAATSRQDLGIYLGLTGGSALDDDVCGHARLEPPLTNNPSYGDANGNAVPDIRGGPWWNAEPGDGVDDCGDIEVGTEAIPILGTPGVPVEIACVDTDEDGLVDVDVCVSWSNGTNDHCTNLGDAIASTNSRCGCGRLDVIGLPEPARLPVLVLGALWLCARRGRSRKSG